MRFKQFAALTLSILFLFVLATIAQEASKDKSPQQPIIVKTNLMIRDTSDRVVEGIKQSDIKILEDGVEQKIEYFAEKEPGFNVAFVMDNTGSVREWLEQITAVGKIITTDLGPKDEGSALRFVGRDKIAVVQPWTTDKSKLLDAMDNLFVEGGQSAIVDALFLASQEVVKRQKDSPRKRFAIVLVTDGEDRDSYHRLKEVFPLLENTDIQIFVVALTPKLPISPTHLKSKTEKFAGAVSAMTGGTTYFLGKKYNDLHVADLLKPLLMELHSQYVIGYTSTNQKIDGVPRKLSVEILDGPKGEKRIGLIKDSVVFSAY